MLECISSYSAIGCNMSMKLYFLHFRMDYPPPTKKNMGAISSEYGKRFHQDISQMEKDVQWKVEFPICWLATAGVITETPMAYVGGKGEVIV